jgi:lipid-A-disaccharide synthase
MLAIVPQLADFKFVVAAVSELSAALYEQASNTPGVEIVYDQTYDLLSQASIAIVASGTATLEAAFLQIPQIVVYKTDLLTYWLAKHCLKIKNIALINILAQKRIVPELIQYQFTEKNLLHALEKMIYSGHVRKQQISNYKRIINSFGKQKASISTAKHIFTYMHPSGYTQDISKVQ